MLRILPAREQARRQSPRGGTSRTTNAVRHAPNLLTPMRKFLRIAVTALSLAACLALVGLWVRSYRVFDTFLCAVPSGHSCQVNSICGQTLWSLSDRGRGVWYWNRSSAPVTEGGRRSAQERPKWEWGTIPPFYFVHFPHWFPALLFALLAAAPWMKWRFSLRTLLIATGLVAVILGAAVATN
jgi:hypothetical protein